MKEELENNRATDSLKQLEFCFESPDMAEQSIQTSSDIIESLAIMPLTAGKVIAFPVRYSSTAEAPLIARILQRTKLFK